MHHNQNTRAQSPWHICVVSSDPEIHGIWLLTGMMFFGGVGRANAAAGGEERITVSWFVPGADLELYLTIVTLQAAQLADIYVRWRIT